MERERLIFHIDVNSAFLSWESVYRLKRIRMPWICGPFPLP